MKGSTKVCNEGKSYCPAVANSNGALRRSCVDNQNHYLITPPANRFCPICGKLTATNDEEVVYEILEGVKLAVCYADLRQLATMTDAYFPKLPRKRARGFTLAQYLKDTRDGLAQKTIGDEKWSNTLAYIATFFYKRRSEKAVINPFLKYVADSNYVISSIAS
jgi:hypothetical protein